MPHSKDMELCHYGIPRRSGRYKWGSGERPYQGDGILYGKKKPSKGPSSNSAKSNGGEKPIKGEQPSNGNSYNPYSDASNAPYKNSDWYKNLRAKQFESLTKGDVGAAKTIQEYLDNFDRNYEKSNDYYKKEVNDYSTSAATKIASEKAIADIQNRNKAVKKDFDTISNELPNVVDVFDKKDRARRNNRAISAQEKDIKNMTTQELEARTARLKAEKNYKDAVSNAAPKYMDEKVSAREIVQSIASAVAISSAVLSLANLGKDFLNK